ncbi:Cell death abnormality protein 1 [Mytilus coruscus]|uniref:Cell death abnormality protein 1 n=1 Tax=Mytilus coruscus TaxID=42192 RepID=A0A6J7ZXY5_MYTCO|nr:Cell death abnormality protein 1 [Mytilus coruscus]
MSFVIFSPTHDCRMSLMAETIKLGTSRVYLHGITVPGYLVPGEKKIYRVWQSNDFPDIQEVTVDPTVTEKENAETVEMAAVGTAPSPRKEPLLEIQATIYLQLQPQNQKTSALFATLFIVLRLILSLSGFSAPGMAAVGNTFPLDNYSTVRRFCDKSTPDSSKGKANKTCLIDKLKKNCIHILRKDENDSPTSDRPSNTSLSGPSNTSVPGPSNQSFPGSSNNQYQDHQTHHYQDLPTHHDLTTGLSTKEKYTCPRYKSDLTTGLSTTEKNACPRYIRRQKPNGQYHAVLEMTCCPNFMEVDNRCLACPAGQYGQNCSEPCLPGRYGQQCKLECNCLTDRCDPKTGCKCKAGYTGANCDKVCPDGYYGMDCKYICDCSENSDCDPETGLCNCHIGYEGRTCNENCRDQFYGQNCSHHCSCPNQQPCHHVRGHCLCPKGFKENTVRKDARCVEGKCDPKDGKCTCSPGYSGRLCNENCPQNSFGDGCNSTCTCDTNSRCHPVTGECLCDPGFNGKDCSKKCSAGFYGPGCIYNCKCSRTSVCNSQTGKCTCDRGWTGEYCDHKCAFGFYGIGCVNRCSCSANHQCHHMTGDCHCEPGKQGSYCNETCDAGKYGMACLKICSCSNCNPVDGVCQQMHIDNDDKATVGMAVGIVVGILVLVGSLLLIIVLKRNKNSRARQQLHQKKRGEVSSNHYEDIDDYAEIPDSKLLPNYPFIYADSTDVKPPIKERQPTTKRKKTNHYLSLTDAQRLSKLSASSGDMKSHGGSTDYLNPYTGLLKDAKCASYQEISKETKERKSNSESIQSESGYVKLSSGTSKTKDSNKRQWNDYTDELPSIRYSNGSDLDRITMESRNDSRSSIQSGYLKMNSSLKRKSETEAGKSTRYMDDKGSQNSVFLPKITISSHNGDIETLNIKNQ